MCDGDLLVVRVLLCDHSLDPRHVLSTAPLRVKIKALTSPTATFCQASTSHGEEARGSPPEKSQDTSFPGCYRVTHSCKAPSRSRSVPSSSLNCLLTAEAHHIPCVSTHGGAAMANHRPLKHSDPRAPPPASSALGPQRTDTRLRSDGRLRGSPQHRHRHLRQALGRGNAAVIAQPAAPTIRTPNTRGDTEAPRPRLRSRTRTGASAPTRVLAGLLGFPPSENSLTRTTTPPAGSGVHRVPTACAPPPRREAASAARPCRAQEGRRRRHHPRPSRRREAGAGDVR